MTVAMLTLIANLADRLIQLTKRSEDIKRGAYADFIAPLMTDLDVVHKDYLESFRRYHQMLDDASQALTHQHPIFEAMSHDNDLTEGIREKIWAALEDATSEDADLREFLFYIGMYLSGPSDNAEASIENILKRLTFSFTSLAEIRLLKALQANYDRKMRNRMVQFVRSSAAIHRMDLCDLPIATDKKRKLAKLVLDDRQDALQSRYRRIIKVHHRIKHKLLTPI